MAPRARKAKPLSSADTLETQPRARTPAEEAARAREDHEHEHAHDHEHEHSHGPVLNPECTRELVLDVPAEEVSKAFRSVTRNYQKYAKLPGFRPGKVPESVFAAALATEIRKEVIDGLLPERFNKAVRELGITPVGQPQVTELTVEEGQPLHVKAVFEYMPDVLHRGLSEQVAVDKPSVEVTDEEFQHEFEQLARVARHRSSQWKKIAPWSMATGRRSPITASLQTTPKPLQSPAKTRWSRLAAKIPWRHSPACCAARKPGQELKAEVIYPADYPEAKLQGKTVAYEVDGQGASRSGRCLS